MTIKEIQEAVAKLNTGAPAPKAKQPPAAVPANKANGNTMLDQDELLAITAARIIAAFALGAHGVTVESMVAGVKSYEKPFEGVVQ